MVALPKQYAVLLSVKSILPKMVQHFLSIYGTREVPGPKSNPEILRWARLCGLEKEYVNDGIAWCGLTVAYLAKMSGKPYPKNPLWALNWREFGVEVKPGGEVCGDVYIRERRKGNKLIGGHVGIIIGEDDTHFHIGGGNQGDMVSIGRFSKAEKYWVRRPRYTNPPFGAQKFTVSSYGIEVADKLV